MDNREQTAPVQCENTRRNTIDELLAGMEMSKSDFWELIAGAKKECGQNMGSSINWLTSQLIARGPQQTQDFHDILNGYMSLSYQYGCHPANKNSKRKRNKIAGEEEKRVPQKRDGR